MARYLVIVESPAKVKTIKKFLGSNYQVAASNGHVRDLPRSQMGIDVDNDFEPKYITIRGKGELLASLRKAAKAADVVYLATDPDREGEAISWHLISALKLDSSKTRRISFNEITKDAVKGSFKKARDIDMGLVDAQQARRALDRLVGYSISPVLWAKVKRGLSAGRVQSVALRIISDRENEIAEFVPEEYWTLNAVFDVDGKGTKLTAKYFGEGDKKRTINSETEVKSIIDEISEGRFEIAELKDGQRVRKAPFPFTTSTLQQEANKVLGFAAAKTMRIAQQLYEGVEIRKQGTVGLITYLRTDSTRISESAQVAARDYINRRFGEDYLAETIKSKKDTGRIQDAHEAIRPTDITREPSMVKEFLTRDQYRLYQLIWKRFTASQMASAVYKTASAKINAGKHVFTASSSRISFKGFLEVYELSDVEKEENLLPASLKQDSTLEFREFEKEQHFTQAPPHYTEASLVKALEELGIGRPSTYAPTIATILARHYVTKEGRSIFMTELGEVVNRIMIQSFPEIVDVNFTANMETRLDKVEEGEIEWKSVLRDFYPEFREHVEVAQKDLEKVKVADEVSDEICDLCGRNMVIKYGPHGKFLACPGFPECKNTKPFLEKAGVKCPSCGGEVVYKRTKKGRLYYGCENAPECDFMSWFKPAEEKCPKCGSYMMIKGKKKVCSSETCGFSI